METHSDHILMNGVFVSNKISLEAGGGGVQWCTRDYIRTLEAAGILVHPLGYETCQGFGARILRKLRPRPFASVHPKGFEEKVIAAAEKLSTCWVFLNNTDANALAPGLRQKAPHLKLVFLSHGIELIDEVNSLRLEPRSLPRYRKTPDWLGRLLLGEVSQRQCLDGVVCISAEDVLFEQWLGSPAAVFVPRSIPKDPIPLKPVRGRVGTVATLSHLPNLNGIRCLAQELAGTAVKLRVVGGPEVIGKKLQNDFSMIEYCGRLSDEDLKLEAASWCAFVNPVFCQARGASTKVATALAWGLPVLTTSQGARGYRWDSEQIPLCSSPEMLAALTEELSFSDCVDEWSHRGHRIAGAAPSLAESGKIINLFLSSLSKTHSFHKKGVEIGASRA